MASKKRRRKRGAEEARPLEIPMTDLNWSEDGEDPRPLHNDFHATGTPGGGLATGGLAGTNIGDGDPDNADLENAMGSGIHDSAGEELDLPPYSGNAGGAVGGTPAEKRARGGHVRRGLTPGSEEKGESAFGPPAFDND
jgi:hypothetical protein